MENTNTQTKTFDFYKDEKCTIWVRGKFQIEAETYEQAVEKIKQMEGNNLLWNGVDIRYEDLTETLEELTPEDNNYDATIEIYSEDTNEIVLTNDPRIPQTN
jgi:hypothetical protein